MPLYVVSHKDPINPSQRDELAAAITKIHTTVFTTPSLFVNVKFEDASDASYYIGGKPARINAIHANVRPGSSRPRSMFDDLCRQLRQAWEHALAQPSPYPNNKSSGEAASTTATTPSLDTIFVLGSIVAGEERGFPLPEAGRDAEWMQENLPEFERRARAGDEEMKGLVEECRAIMGAGADGGV